MSITDPATTGTTLANTNPLAIVPTTGTHYVIVMAHAKSNIPNGVLYLGTRLGTTNTLNPSSATTGQPVNMGTAAFTRIISV
jgi:hypothetical protein